MDQDSKRMEDLLARLSKPVDISKKSNEDKANILALSFIGYATVDKSSISPEAYKASVEAFRNCTAGKIEREAEDIKLALDKFYPEEESND